MDHIWRLKHFLAIAELGSVQGAARTLGISQPALSKSLQILESYLQTTLFDRSTRGLTLTSLGQVFYRRAKEIQSEWDNSLIELNATRDGAQGELRIGVGPTYAVVFMRRVLSQLSRDYPNLRVSVRTGVGALLMPALHSGEISLYAGGLRDTDERSGEGIEELFLYEQTNHIVAARHSELVRKGQVALKELCQRPWVLLSYDSTATRQIEKLFRSKGLVAPRSTVSTNSLQIALDLVRHEGFLTSLPAPLLHPNVNPELSALNLPDYNWKIRSGVTYRSSVGSIAPLKAILTRLKNDVETLELGGKPVVRRI